MKNDETAAAILALPDTGSLADGHVEYWNGVMRFMADSYVDKADLKALAESWQQQNAMLEAARQIRFTDNNYLLIHAKGTWDVWFDAVQGFVTAMDGKEFDTALEAYNAITKEKNDAG